MNLARQYGRSKSGTPLIDLKPSHSSQTVNTIAILSIEGVQAPYMYTCTLTASFFVDYLKAYVVPLLKNNETLIMDNHRVHHAKIVKQFFEEQGINVLYLPAYSPELNPIEEAFSKVKNYIRKQRAWTLTTLKPVIKNAFDTITKTDAKNYFNHANQVIV